MGAWQMQLLMLLGVLADHLKDWESVHACQHATEQQGMLICYGKQL